MNIIELKSRKEFREWLSQNSEKEKECWIPHLKRGKPKEQSTFYYIDAVEEALCFGWIDSVYKKIDGTLYQKFSPRVKKSNWTILNIERVKRLERLGLMTEKGLSIVPKTEFVMDGKVLQDIKNGGIEKEFFAFPELYQKIKVFNLASIRNNSEELYQKSLMNLIQKTKEGKMVGEWNDYGRLLS